MLTILFFLVSAAGLAGDQVMKSLEKLRGGT
jgi:hypothetical protein